MNSRSPCPPSPAMVLALGLFAVPATGCVITDVPQFQTPQHTRPFLLAPTALPNPAVVQQLDIGTNQPMTFSAEVVSQDDPAGSDGQFQKVSSKLYIDYGFSPAPGYPFRWQIPGTVLEPSTLDVTTGRVIQVTWTPSVYMVSAGCHTATLVVSHIFDPTPGCPACDDDYATLTWQVIACDMSDPTKPCTGLPLSGTSSGLANCPVPAINCDIADPPATRMCPESMTDADAGTP